MGVGRYARKDDVGFESNQLLAFPACGTFLDALLRTDRIAEIAHAQAGKAVAVLIARVEETAGTWLTDRWAQVDLNNVRFHLVGAPAFLCIKNSVLAPR